LLIEYIFSSIFQKAIKDILREDAGYKFHQELASLEIGRLKEMK